MGFAPGEQHMDKIVYLAAPEKERVPQQLSDKVEVHKKEKLRTAKMIIDKIKWDENIEQGEFKVGYLDKYEGILELAFD